MVARKLSISVPPDVETSIKAAADREGVSVSAWLTDAATQKADRAARDAAGRAAALELVADYERHHGPLPETTRNQARLFLAEVGLLPKDEAAAG